MANIKTRAKKPVASSAFACHLPLAAHKQLAELAIRNSRSIRAEAWLAIRDRLQANGFDAGEKK